MAAAHRFVELLTALERSALSRRHAIPTSRERRVLFAEFWGGLVAKLEHVERCVGEAELRRARCEVRAVLIPALTRSRFWDRSYVKPHAHAGDSRMRECALAISQCQAEEG